MAAHKGHPGGCKVCGHVERTRIELLLAGGAGQTAIAKKFGLSKDSVHRHWHGHVSEERRAALVMGPTQRMALSARVSEESESVLDHLKAVRAGLYQLYAAALDAGDRQTGALVAGRLHENLNAMARLTGELATSPLVSHTTNIFMLPAVAAFQSRIIAALRPFPAARAAVIAEFEKSEASPAVPQLTRTPETIDADPTP